MQSPKSIWELDRLRLHVVVVVCGGVFFPPPGNWFTFICGEAGQQIYLSSGKLKKTLELELIYCKNI